MKIWAVSYRIYVKFGNDDPDPRGTPYGATEYVETDTATEAETLVATKVNQPTFEIISTEECPDDPLFQGMGRWLAAAGAGRDDADALFSEFWSAMGGPDDTTQP